VHRVQRVPVTDGAGKVQTSTATVAVMPEVHTILSDTSFLIALLCCCCHSCWSNYCTPAASYFTYIQHLYVCVCVCVCVCFSWSRRAYLRWKCARSVCWLYMFRNSIRLGTASDVMWYDVMRCDVLWHDVMWCDTEIKVQ
jgi:PCRF domain